MSSRCVVWRCPKCGLHHLSKHSMGLCDHDPARGGVLWEQETLEEHDSHCDMCQSLGHGPGSEIGHPILNSKKRNYSIDDPYWKGYLSKSIEKWVRKYISDHRKQIIHEIYPEFDGDEHARTQYCVPDANEGAGVMGKLKKMSGYYTLYGWHGDLAFILTSKSIGKKAIIFEVKWGHSRFTNGQSKFFKQVIKTPSKFMSKLNQVEIYTVNVSEVDFVNKTLNMQFNRYRRLVD